MELSTPSNTLSLFFEAWSLCQIKSTALQSISVGAVSQVICLQKVEHDLISCGRISVQCQSMTRARLDVRFQSRRPWVERLLDLRQVVRIFAVAAAGKGIVFSQEKLQPIP